MTFPSGIVPKTTNKTAGNTPYPSFCRNLKRKLDYSSTGKIVRKVNRGKLLSVKERMTQNKLFYDILPDGVVCFYSAQGSPDGPTGYLAPMLKALTDALSSKDSKWSELLKRHSITTVLPIKDLRTGMAKKLQFANGTKSMDVKGIVYIFDSVEDNNTTNCDLLCTNLVREAVSTFNIKITVGGNAASFGGNVPDSLDCKFLAEDVANLAMLSYREAIQDGSFFEDDNLVFQYFMYCPNVKALFANLFGV